MEKKSTFVLKGILYTLLILIAIFLSSTGLVNDLILETPYINTMDVQAKEYFDSSLKKALYTFGIARGLNAVISVIQEIEITPLVASIPVGEVLDPVNDLIERFSWVMLLSTTSIGIQKFLMEIGNWVGFQLLLTGSLFVLLIGIWLSGDRRNRYLNFSKNIFIISLLIRFCIPIIGMTTGQVHNVFLKEKTDEATEAIKKSKEEIESQNIAEELEDQDTQNEEDETDWWDKAKSIYNGAKSYIDIGDKLSQIKSAVANATENIIDIITVFILQTIVIPIIVLWLMMKLVQHLTGRSFQNIEDKLKSKILEKKSPIPGNTAGLEEI